MKRIIALLLVCVLAVSCAGCSFIGDTKWQEEEALAFVEKYYSGATIEAKEKLFFDTTTVYTMKDKVDGFEYSLATMEVYMSDLAFAVPEGKKDKTIVFDSSFLMNYTANLIKNKVDKDKLNAIIEKYKDVNYTIIVEPAEVSILDVASCQSYQIAFLMDELNVNAIQETVDLLKVTDERSILTSLTLPIYIGKTEKELELPKSYFDIYFNRIITEKEYDGVAMLHDWLLNQDYKSVLITSIDTGYASSNFTLDKDESWADNSKTTGTRILFTADGKSYEFYNSLIVDKFDTEHDEYGIYKGSFLDIMATEKTGAKPVLISMYATMMPLTYSSLSVYMKEVKEEAKT